VTGEKRTPVPTAPSRSPSPGPWPGSSTVSTSPPTCDTTGTAP